MSQKRAHQGTVIERRPIIGRGFLESSSNKPLGVLYVSSRAPFMSLVNRAIKELDKGPGGAKWSATKVLPLQDRIDAAQKATESGAGGKGAAALPASHDRRAIRQREVLLVASGHAIEKLLLVAAWFRRRGEYAMALRTFWSSAVDDVVCEQPRSETSPGEDDGDQRTSEEEKEGRPDYDAMDIVPGPEVYVGAKRAQTRVRQVSCVELAVRLK